MVCSQCVLLLKMSTRKSVLTRLLLQFGEDGISTVSYEDTDSFAVTKDFLSHYPRRLEQLFADP
ncbi:hypothetical protein GCM10011408_18790 [Dyella caseinilytica]|nr:hypothetical protein GCM10011408_18790 [Dyella caseinilytica]